MRRPSKTVGYLRGAIFRLHPAVRAARDVRLDRRPLIRRKAAGSSVRLASRVRLFPGVAFYLRQAGATVSIGERTYVGRRSEFHCDTAISIGSDCAVSWDVQFIDSDQHTLVGSRPTAPIVVGDRVWIGQRATILKGVTVGDGAVIAAGSVVTRDVPGRSVVAGIPARVVKSDVDWE
jgi:acetyltransferase-like isoleucine patch superfamily enzyme